MFDAAVKLIKRLQNSGFEAFIVGGALPDRFLNKIPHDYDIVTSALPEQVVELFGNSVKPDIGKSKSFGIVIVVIDGIPFDVATFRKDGPYTDGRRPDFVEFPVSAEIDQKRRDLTMNGIMWNPITDEFLDYVNGREDIQNRIIRFIGEPRERILEDGLRILRVVRFEATTGFTIEPSTLQACRDYAHRLDILSAERIQAEFLKGLASDRPVQFIERLRSTGMLQYIFPELLDMTSCPQNPIFHPEGNVWVHAILALEEISKLSNDPLLRFAALSHDVGKPPTCAADLTCHGHDDVGADIVKNRMITLKFSNADIEYVTNLIRRHMNVFSIYHMKKSKVLAFSSSPWFSDLLNLLHADIVASMRDPRRSIDEIKQHVERIQAESGSVSVPKSLLNGNQIMEILGIQPGPQLRELKDALIEAQIEGIVLNPDDAMNFIRGKQV